MIHLDRPSKPKILANNEKQWLKDYLAALNKWKLATNKSTKQNLKKAKDKLEKKYNNREVRKALISMTDGIGKIGKCAFCESHITHVSYSHIEHFKPKQIYPKLCFIWSNLLLSCGVCNGAAYKGTKFPLDNNGKAIYINPAKENPTDFFEFEFDINTNTANVVPQHIRAVTMEKDLGLNREDLVIHRSKLVKNILYITLKARDGDDEALELLSEAMKKESEYAAFARALHKKYIDK